MKGLLTANVRSHASRYVATSVAIALATAFILTCLTIANGFFASIERAVAADTQGADVVISLSDNVNLNSDKQREIMRQVADEVENSADFPETRTIYYNFTQVQANGFKQMMRTIPMPQEPFKALPLKDGAYPTARDQIVIDSGTAGSLHAKIGDSLTIKKFIFPEGADAGSQPNQEAAPNQPEERTYTFKVTGILDSGSISIPTGILHPEVAKELVAPEDTPAYVLIAGSDPETVKSFLKAKDLLPDYLDVTDQKAFVSSSLNEFVGGAGVMLAVLFTFPVLALITAIIVVSTTFNVLLTQRRRELALLRAIGATRQQVSKLARREALLVGAVSALFGILAGGALGAGLVYLAKLTPSLADSLGTITALNVAIAFFAGLFITFAASTGPVRQIAGLSPMVALQPEDVQAQSTKKRIGRLVAGLITFTLGTSLMIFSVLQLNGGAKFGFAFLGGCVSFLGALFLVGLVMPQIAGFLGRLLGKGNLTTQLAGENTLRNPTRTGATGTALFLGVTLVVMIMVGSASLKHSLLTTLDEKRPVDVVAVQMGEGDFNSAEQARVGKLPHLEKAVYARGFYGSVQLGEDVVLPLISEDVDLTGVTRGTQVRVSDNEVLVPFNELGDRAGQMLTVAVGNEKLELKAVGINAPVWKVSPATYAKLSAQVKDAPQISPGNQPLLGQVSGVENTKLAYFKLDADTSFEDVTLFSNKVQNGDDLVQLGGGLGERLMYTNVLNVMLAGVVGMLAISILVALVGVANTLALSVVERRRENALLRALGMTRASVRHMLSIEALLIGVASLILGIGLGVFYGWMGFLAVHIDDLSVYAPSIPWLQVLGVAVAVTGAALLASLLPGRKAAKAHPVEAMAGVN